MLLLLLPFLPVSSVHSANIKPLGVAPAIPTPHIAKEQMFKEPDGSMEDMTLSEPLHCKRCLKSRVVIQMAA
jgi:hypothetical protein